jgi:hypothetical protein
MRAAAVGSGTHANRSVAWRHWETFMTARGRHPLVEAADDAGPALGEAFVAHLVLRRKLLGPTAKKYLQHVGSCHRKAGLPNPVDFRRCVGDWHLAQTVQGALKMAPGGLRKKRGFSALDLTERLFKTPDFAPSLLTGLRNRAVASAALLGLARSQMYCVSSKKAFNAYKHVTRGDVKFSEDLMLMTIWVPAGKTDPIGHAQPYGRTGLDLCAVRSIRAWLLATAGRPHSDPLFGDQLGNPLTYSQWYATTRRSLKAAGMSLVDYGTHSYRRGGATALFNACGDITEVQTLGGWAPDSTTAWDYVDVDAAHLASHSRLIAAAAPIQAPPLVLKRQRDIAVAAAKGGKKPASGAGTKRMRT